MDVNRASIVESKRNEVPSKDPNKISIIMKNMTSKITNIKPKDTQEPNSCPSCNASVPIGCFGKHLVSHFHHYHLKNRDLHNKLILEHIHGIVKQAPFQCHICMFYCNFEEQFLDHWKSEHTSETCGTSDNFGFWCSACQIISLRLTSLYCICYDMSDF